jgi:hypothetical protein
VDVRVRESKMMVNTAEVERTNGRLSERARYMRRKTAKVERER